MDKEALTERLTKINTDLKHGMPKNPARFNVDAFTKRVVVDVFSKEEGDELIKLIGEWSYKKEVVMREKLELEKKMLESELKKLL